MDNKQIKELMASMKEFKVKKILFKRKDFEIEIEAEGDVGIPPVAQPAQHHFHPHPFHPQAHHGIPAPAAPAQEAVKPVVEEGVHINSPMVGTYYSAADPKAPPMVKVGDTVKKGQKICIIEAMKVFNEITSDKDGVITAVLVENGKPVEYGQPLVRIKTN